MNHLSINDKNHYPTTATIGFFDGVHLGHRYLIERLKAEAAKKNERSMIITFANHPRLYFQPDCGLKELTLPEERIELLGKTGLDYTLLLKFDNKISTLTSEEFIKFIAENYEVKTLLVGYDHRFGSDRKSTPEDYIKYGEKYGVEVKLQDNFLENNVAVSSSKIRKALNSGEIETANEYLGYKYYIKGEVINGNKIGRTIDFPTANIKTDSLKLIPKNGVYGGIAHIKEKKYATMINIGVRPTVGKEDKISIESHIIGYNGSLYGETIKIEFVKYIRDEQKFESLESLKNQLYIDKEIVSEVMTEML